MGHGAKGQTQNVLTVGYSDASTAEAMGVLLMMLPHTAHEERCCRVEAFAPNISWVVTTFEAQGGLNRTPPTEADLCIFRWSNVDFAITGPLRE